MNRLAGGTHLSSQSPRRAGRGPTYTPREIHGVPGIAVVLHLQGDNPPRLHEANLMRKRVVSQQSPCSVYLYLSPPTYAAWGKQKEQDTTP